MAKTIQVVHAYGPRIRLLQQMSEKRFLELTTLRSTFSASVVMGVLMDMTKTLIGALREGRSVDTRIGVFTSCVDLDGQVNVKVRVKKEFLRELNTPGAFEGKVVNAEFIGQPFSALVEHWNAEHPDDPVE
jgi:hypothetical protein